MTNPNQQITNLKTRLARILKEKLAQGNNKDAWIDAIKIERSKFLVSATLRHHQVWDSPFVGKVITYNITTPFTISIDTSNMSVDGNLCVDLPTITGGGRVCLTAQEILALIA